MKGGLKVKPAVSSSEGWVEGGPGIIVRKLPCKSGVGLGRHKIGTHGNAH